MLCPRGSSVCCILDIDHDGPPGPEVGLDVLCCCSSWGRLSGERIAKALAGVVVVVVVVADGAGPVVDVDGRDEALVPPVASMLWSGSCSSDFGSLGRRGTSVSSSSTSAHGRRFPGGIFLARHSGTIGRLFARSTDGAHESSQPAEVASPGSYIQQRPFTAGGISITLLYLKGCMYRGCGGRPPYS